MDSFPLYGLFYEQNNVYDKLLSILLSWLIQMQSIPKAYKWFADKKSIDLLINTGEMNCVNCYCPHSNV